MYEQAPPSAEAVRSGAWYCRVGSGGVVFLEDRLQLGGVPLGGLREEELDKLEEVRVFHACPDEVVDVNGLVPGDFPLTRVPGRRLGRPLLRLPGAGLRNALPGRRREGRGGLCRCPYRRPAGGACRLRCLLACLGLHTRGRGRGRRLAVNRGKRLDR